jgi:hypothetical protein
MREVREHRRVVRRVADEDELFALGIEVGLNASAKGFASSTACRSRRTTR